MRDRPQEGDAPKSRWNITVQNLSSEAAPPYAALQVIGSTAFGNDTVYSVVKPNGAPGAEILLNSPAAIEPNGYGAATDSYPAEVAITGTPAFGAELGPTGGLWQVSVNGKGFAYLGGLAGGVGRVAARAGTTAGDDYPLVKIVNVSGLAKQFGNIVGYGTPVDPPPATLYRIPTYQSAAPQRDKPFVVLFNDVANGGTVDAGPVGDLPVQIDYKNADHRFARPINNDYAKLESCPMGPAEIIWRAMQGVSGGGTLGVQWARVRVAHERYRLVRGEAVASVTSSTSRFEIDNIRPLASGLDPRSVDSPSERIWVANIHGEEYAADDKVVAVYSEKVIASPQTDWEALRKGGTATTTELRFGEITTAASAATTGGTPTTDGRVQLFARWGGATVAVNNYHPDNAPVNAVAVLSGTDLVTWSCRKLP